MDFNPSLVPLLPERFAVRKRIYCGELKYFIIDLNTGCVYLDLSSGWVFKSSKPYHTYIKEPLTGRRIPRDPVEVIARELTCLPRHTFDLLLCDYLLHGHVKPGQEFVNKTIESLRDDYELSIRPTHSCRFANGPNPETTCFSPFHCGAVYRNEPIRESDEKKCYAAFIKEPSYAVHPKGYIAVGVPRWTWQKAREDFLAVEKARQLRESQTLLDSLADRYDEQFK